MVFDQKKDEKTPVLTVLERTTEPLLKADRPWEDASIGIDQVLRIGDQWHLWYATFDHNSKNDNDCYFCYARSKDVTVLVYAAFSRDGKLFSRLGRTFLLGLGKGFDKMGVYVSAGAVPGEKPGTYWIYYERGDPMMIPLVRITTAG